MATYSITTNARQDAALAYVAQKAGAASVDAYVQQQLARIVQRALNERDRDDADRIAAAYVGADTATQAQMRSVLGLP